MANDGTARRAKVSESARAGHGATPKPGEVWTLSSSIEDRSGAVIEHSRVPVLVVVLRRVAELFEVAPLSFEVDLRGSFDAQLTSVFGRPAIAETWLRMPITRRALQSRALVLSAEDLTGVMNQLTRAATEDAPTLPEDDPRRSYRQEERLRVIFAMAGTGEEIELPDEAEPDTKLDHAREKALRVKRGETRPQWRPQPADGAGYPGAFHPAPAPVGPSNTPPREPVSR